MESAARLPRFKRASTVAPIQLTERDRNIIRHVHRHRFLRSSQIVALIGDSSQQLLRRLQLLFHHGFLERPRAQIDYYHRGGSRQIVYGLGKNGAECLKSESSLAVPVFHSFEKNRSVGRLFLEHALLVSEVMVALELACRRSGRVRLLSGREIPLPAATARLREPIRWSVTTSYRLKLGVIPDHVLPNSSTPYRFLWALSSDQQLVEPHIG